MQKMSLPERVDGAPNFRRVPLSIAGSEAVRTPAPNSRPGMPKPPGNSATLSSGSGNIGPSVYGTGMPTIDGLRNALHRMGAEAIPILWQSLREEPVLYIAGRPHVSGIVASASSLLTDALELATGPAPVRPASGERRHHGSHHRHRRGDGGCTEGRPPSRTRIYRRQSLACEFIRLTRRPPGNVGS